MHVLKLLLSIVHLLHHIYYSPFLLVWIMWTCCQNCVTLFFSSDKLKITRIIWQKNILFIFGVNDEQYTMRVCTLYTFMV